MKIFLYKTLIVFFFIFIFYQFTIGVKIREVESKLNNLSSSENIELVKDKIRNEIKTGLNKENYFSDEDAQLLSDFLNKINSELKIK
tara:strand:+ start:37 stop:297 length:261 start_codon:yes stop_codon:yes gene_type:complete